MTAYLGLGSNKGDRAALLVRAVEMLSSFEGVLVQKVSPVYETEPVGGPPQDFFLNAAVRVETILDAYVLFDCCQRVEDQLERVRREKWGPRTIDIDLLLYNSMIIQTDELTIPHPRLTERAFVLRPLMDIAPDMVHPGNGEKISVLYERVDSTGVHRYDTIIPGWPN